MNDRVNVSHLRLPAEERHGGRPRFPFYLFKYTYAAAVMTENRFMDSKVSLAFLESDEGKNAIIALHVDGIEHFIIRRSHEPL